jgi:Bacterial sugar transferase
MSCASFTNLPVSTKCPARSVAVSREIPVDLGKRRLTVLLISAAASEFLFVAIAAYVAAVLYHRLILVYSPDPARYLPEALLIATLDLLVGVGHRQYSRIQTQPRHAFLWNGVVGPRPHAVAQNEVFAELISSFSRRHNVRPGIIGWAHVNGYRGDTDALEKMQRRVAHDLCYIDNWSLLLDLKIMVMTLFSRKAYWNTY